MKKLVVLGLSLALCMGLVSACSEPADPLEGAELVFWDIRSGSSSNSESPQKLAERFNRENEHGIKVEYVSFSITDHSQMLRSVVGTEKSPDVATVEGRAPLTYASYGEALELTGLLESREPDADGIAADIPGRYLEPLRSGESQYGLPHTLEPRGFLYNRELFERTGLDPLAVESWEDFTFCLEQIQAEVYDMIPLILSTDDRDALLLLSQLLAQNGASLDSITSVQGIETLEFLRMLVDSGLISEGNAEYDGSLAQRMFQENRAAVTFGGSSRLNAAGSKAGVLPAMRGYSSSEAVSVVGVTSIMCFAETDYPEASQLFAYWWLEHSGELYGSSRYPAKASLYDNRLYRNNDAYVEILEHTVLPGVPEWMGSQETAQAEKICGRLLREILSGGDFRALAAEVQPTLAELLAEPEPI